MEFLEIEGCYKDGQIILDEEPQGITSAKVTVTFLPNEQGEKERKALERETAIKRLFASMEKKWDLGGGPYYRDRGELYEED